MHVFLVRRASVIFPFDRIPDECGWGLRTLAADRARTLTALRLDQPTEVDDGASIDGPALILSDDVWVTRRALSGFLKQAKARAKTSGDVSRLALPSSRFLELTTPLQDLPEVNGRCAFDVAFVPEGKSVTARSLFVDDGSDVARWIDVPFREVPVEVRASPYIFGRGASTMVLPLTSSIAMRIRHWVHVLRASHFLPQVEILNRASSAPLSTAWRGLCSVRATKRGRERALKANFVFKGKRTFIHPTATVEASVLGDDVVIGAHAYVVGSVLGDGTCVEERAHVNASAVGPRTYISRNSTISACNVFGDTDACTNGIQGCVISERSGFTSFARPLDVAFGAPVMVKDGAQLRSVGELPCGVAFGADVFVGADVSIAAGRAVPAGVRLVNHPDRVLRDIPADLPAGSFVVVENGRAKIISGRRPRTRDDTDGDVDDA